MALTPRSAWLILAGMVALFVLRVGLVTSTTLRGIDEAHCAVAAARVVAEGGPLYANSVTNYGPLTHTVTALAFRVGGLYNMQAVRLAHLAWWAATALVVYRAALTMMGRAASLAAAGAFLLAALNPGFQEIRGEPLTPLPLAAAVGLCVSGVAGRSALRLLLAGAAIGVAVLAKQQAGIALPVLAGYPLLVWLWRRPSSSSRQAGEGLWVSACAAGLVAAGFAAVMAVVWLYYAARGAGHAYFFCVWTHNWSFVRCSPSGRFLPSLPFFWGRVARYVFTEPLFPLAIAGAAVALVRRGGPEATVEGAVWRPRVVMLAALFLILVAATCPGDIPPMPVDKYVHYTGLVYVPMSLLVGICVALVTRLRGGRRDLALVTAALLLAYVVVPATRWAPAVPRAPSVVSSVSLYFRMFGVWQVIATVGATAAAGWLLGGGRLAWLAPLAWAAGYVAAPGSLGWEGAHLPAAMGLVALGLLRRARDRGSPALAAAAGIVHAAASCVTWSPQAGVSLGAALWLMIQPALPRGQRCVLAVLYLLCVLPVSVAVMGLVGGWEGIGVPTVSAVLAWWDLVHRHLLSWRGAGTAAVCGVLLVAWGGRPLGAALALARDHSLGLLALGAFVALVCGAARSVEPQFLAEFGAALAMAAAFGVETLLRPPAGEADVRPSVLMASGCLVAGVIALASSLCAPMSVAPLAPYDRMASVIPPGSRAFVWGPMFALDLCVRSRLVVTAPQYSTWMVEAVGLPPYGEGVFGYPRVATLAALDECLSRDPPPYVVIMDEPSPTPADLPRFGPILRARYRVLLEADGGKVYRLASAVH